MRTSNPPADIILYGGPASGKSTQAELLAHSLKAAHMNMGGLLRAEVKRGSRTAKEIQRYMAAGKLVPERISSTLVQQFVSRVPKSKRIVFDGYPRRMAQVRIIEPAIKRAGRNTVMVFIDLPASVARARIKRRAESQGRADDQNLKVINERLRVFRQHAQPMLKFYRATNRLVTIDGDQTVAAIERAIAKTVRALK